MRGAAAASVTIARLKARQHQSPFTKDVAQHIDRAFVALELARSARKRKQQDAAMEHYTACIALFLSTLPLITDPKSDELVRTQLHGIMGEAEELKAALLAADAECSAAPLAADAECSRGGGGGSATTTVEKLAPASAALGADAALTALIESSAAGALPLPGAPLLTRLPLPLAADDPPFGADSEERSADASVEEGEAQAQAPAPTNGVATRRALALFDFEPHDATELALVEGDQLLVLAPATGGDHEGWIFIGLKGKTGYVPAAFVELV